MRFAGLVPAGAWCVLGLASCGLDTVGRGTAEPLLADSDATADVTAPTRDGGLASPDAGPGDSGSLPVADPGRVVCGVGNCTPGQARCCIENGGVRCVQTGTSSCYGSEVNCDETADCATGVCCLTRDDNFSTRASSYCRATCSGAQVCKSNAECSSGACIAIQCAGRTWGTCGGAKPPQCP